MHLLVFLKINIIKTALQVTVLLPSGQNMNAANLHVLSNVTDAPQALLEPVSQVKDVCFSYTFDSPIVCLTIEQNIKIIRQDV